MTFTCCKAMLLAFFVIAFSNVSYAFDVKEGTHYVKLDSKINNGENSSRVVKYLSLGCSPCRMMSQFIPELEQGIDQKIEKEHVVFNESSKDLAILFYSAKVQVNSDVEQKFFVRLFELVQSGPSNQQEIASLFESKDLQAPQQMGEEMTARVIEQAEYAELVTNKARINAVPGFVVDGKYLVKLQNHRSIEDMVGTMNYLLSLPEA